MTRIANQESRILAAGFLMAMLSACGKKPDAGEALETTEYRAWKGSQVLRQLPAATFAETVQGTLVVLPPDGRSKNPDDFCELYLNGNPVQRFRVGKMPGGQWPQGSASITLVAGAAWLDLWDSSSNRNYRTQVDTRQGTDFVFTPTETGYALTWTKREP